jgi:hypothetical protein
MRTLACAVLATIVVAWQDARAQPRPSPVGEFVGWLNQPSRQWLATAQLQRFPEAAIPHLLEPGRAVLGPHGDLTPALLTLAKIGEPAIPAIVERMRAILRRDERYATQETLPLIKVLGLIGPSAVPALVQFSEIDDDWTGLHALTAIVGQVVSPWLFWRPADDRLVRLEKAIVPLLPASRRRWTVR